MTFLDYVADLEAATRTDADEHSSERLGALVRRYREAAVCAGFDCRPSGEGPFMCSVNLATPERREDVSGWYVFGVETFVDADGRLDEGSAVVHSGFVTTDNFRHVGANIHLGDPESENPCPQ